MTPTSGMDPLMAMPFFSARRPALHGTILIKDWIFLFLIHRKGAKNAKKDRKWTLRDLCAFAVRN